MIEFKREKYGAEVATIHEDGDQIVEVVRRGDGRFDLTIHRRRAHGDLWDRKMSRVMAPDLAEFYSDADELKARRDFMIREGYRFCSIPACNCNSWHGGRAMDRLNELRDLLDEYGVPTNGIVLKDAIEAALKKAGYTND